MALTKKEYTIEGRTPSMQSNGRLANPLDPIAKAIKSAKATRDKTDDHYVLVSSLEWIGSIYGDEPGTFEIDKHGVTIAGFGKPVWPGENLEAMLIAGAKKKKKGTQFKAAIMVDGDFPIIYDGPKTIEKLFGNAAFSDTRGAGGSGSTVQRTRPIFRDWKLKFTVTFDPSLVNEREIDDVLEICGAQIGLSDYRPKYGRFAVVE